LVYGLFVDWLTFLGGACWDVGGTCALGMLIAELAVIVGGLSSGIGFGVKATTLWKTYLVDPDMEGS